MKSKILVVGGFDEAAIGMLSDFEIVQRSIITEDDLRLEIKEVVAIIVRAGMTLTREHFETAKSLRVVARFGVGVDNIDLLAAREHGVSVVNAPGINANSVAEHAMACILALSRSLFPLDASIRRGDWGSRERYVARELRGLTLAVIGMGDIGERIATAARYGFGMNIVYVDPFERPILEHKLGAAHMSLDDALAQADVMTLHVPLIPQTFHMLSTAEFNRMKADAILLNFSRGQVVDEAALLDALSEGKITGAVLDVFETEPLVRENRILTARNTILTPHTAGLSVQANERMAVQLARDILAVLAGKEPQNLVIEDTANVDGCHVEEVKA